MNEQIWISFPGLGIEEFSLSKIAFTLFGRVDIRWYGVVITLGIALAFLYATWRGKRNEGIISDDVLDVGIVTVLLGVIGARAYYVLTDRGGSYDSLYDVIAIWEGGLAIYGGIIGGCLGILIMCGIKRIRWQKLFDMAAPGVMIAQAVGRFGNFFNGEAYGYRIADTTNYYFFNQQFVLESGEGTLFHTLRMGLVPNMYGANLYYFHPTFLYESAWNVLGFVLINLFYKHKKFDGQVALMYFTWYGFGRMFIEGLRTDSLYLPGTTLRISQCLGLACFAVGMILLIVLSTRKKHEFMTVREVVRPVPAPESEEEREARLEDQARRNDEAMEGLLSRLAQSKTEYFTAHVTEKKERQGEKNPECDRAPTQEDETNGTSN